MLRAKLSFYRHFIKYKNILKKSLPLLPNTRTVPLPMPFDPPVTMATLSKYRSDIFTVTASWVSQNLTVSLPRQSKLFVLLHRIAQLLDNCKNCEHRHLVCWKTFPPFCNLHTRLVTWSCANETAQGADSLLRTRGVDSSRERGLRLLSSSADSLLRRDVVLGTPSGQG